MTEEERSKTPPPPKRDNWLSMKKGGTVKRYDDDQEAKYNQLIEKDKKIIKDFQYQADKALYDQNDYTTFMKNREPLSE